MQSSLLYNAQIWLGHADKIRLLSQSIDDTQTKQHMMAVAAGFDRIASLATELNVTGRQVLEPNRRFTSRLWRSAA